MRPLVDLHGARVLVTGGASGIGASIVDLASELGASVGVIDLQPCESADVSVEADISSPDGAFSAVKEVCDQLGGLDALVNNAGIAPAGAFESISASQWRKTLAINMDGAFYCTQAALPHLRQASGGSIVNMASIAGRSHSRTASVAYAASKGGVVAMTRQLAYELAHEGIRVNCVCPGLVDTRIMAQNTTPEALANLISTIPLGRLASPSEVASVACFLASEASSYLTGSIIDANGGLA